MSGQVVEVPPKTWTKVLYGGGVEILVYYGSFLKKLEPISWRRYSAMIPFYTAGDSPTDGLYSAWIMPPYTDFWFYSNDGNVVTWSTEAPS